MEHTGKKQEDKQKNSMNKSNYKIVSVPVSHNANVFHFFFWKIHSPNVSQKQPHVPANRTIFVTNLPIQSQDITKQCLESIFRILVGPITSIVCDTTHAHIVFEEECVEKAALLDVFITLDVADIFQGDNAALKSNNRFV